MKRFAVVIALLAAAGEAGEARASSCAIDAVQPLVFGAYDPFSISSLDAAGSITWSCTDLDAEDMVIIEVSAGSSGVASLRELQSASGVLAYDVFTDAARTSRWADGTGGTSHYGPVHDTGATVPIYGRIPARQNAGAGSYSDIVQVTLVF